MNRTWIKLSNSDVVNAIYTYHTSKSFCGKIHKLIGHCVLILHLINIPISVRMGFIFYVSVCALHCKNFILIHIKKACNDLCLYCNHVIQYINSCCWHNNLILVDYNCSKSDIWRTIHLVLIFVFEHVNSGNYYLAIVSINVYNYLQYFSFLLRFNFQNG